MLCFIKFERAWGFIPVPVFSTNWLPSNWLGLSLGFLIALKPHLAHDEASLAHELAHCKQFYRLGGLPHFFLYWLSKDYRLKAEIEAFAAEIVCTEFHERPFQIQEASRALASCYGLQVSEQDAISMLGQEVSALLLEHKRAIA